MFFRRPNGKSQLMQVDSNERSEVDAGYIPAFSNSFTLFCCSVLHNKLLEKGLIK